MIKKTKQNNQKEQRFFTCERAKFFKIAFPYMFIIMFYCHFD